VTDGRGGCVGEEEVPEVEVDVTVGARMLIEVDDRRGTLGVTRGDRGLLERLPQRRVLRTFTRFDVPTGLEPAPDAAMQMQEHESPAGVEDERGRGHVRREGGPRERIALRAPGAGLHEEVAQPVDGRSFQGVDARMDREVSQEVADPRVPVRDAVGRAVARDGQLQTSFVSTAPVESIS
jgi:hypothetical protein